MTSSADRLLARLETARAAGEFTGSVQTDSDVVESASADQSRAPHGVAAALVRARRTADVQVVLRLAHDEGVPVVTQGSRTGLVGASSALEGCVLLDVSGMNRILEIDPVNRVAIVEPGVIVADLHRAAAAAGLFYAPDPASSAMASVGGTIATNAGGMRCVKYGVTRDAVRSLEVVLADGEVVRTRPATAKGVASLDLTSLIVGSEGTLGVVTQATLALLPAPGPLRGVAAIFPTAADAFAAANAIVAGERLPATLEFIDEVALRGIRQVRPDLGLPEDAAAWLLAITDAHADAGADLDAFEAAVQTHGAIEWVRADEPYELDLLFEARRELNAGIYAVRGGATHGDLAIPRSQLPAFAAGVDALRERHDLEITLAGHVGDGNLHPTVIFDPADAEETALAHAVAAEIALLGQRLGGTVAGEHGVGTVKQFALDGEVPPRIRDLQRQIKAVFDPRNILNPGRKL